MIRGTRTVCGRRIGSDRGGQGGGNGVEFPSSVEPRAGRGGAVGESSRRPTERTQAAAPTERTRRDLRSRTNPRIRLISTIRLLTTPGLRRTRVAARPCSARRRIPTIPCGRSWPAMVNERLTAGSVQPRRSSGAKAACQNRSAERSPDPATRQEDIGTVQIAVVRTA